MADTQEQQMYTLNMYATSEVSPWLRHEVYAYSYICMQYAIISPSQPDNAASMKCNTTKN